MNKKMSKKVSHNFHLNRLDMNKMYDRIKVEDKKMFI